MSRHESEEEQRKRMLDQRQANLERLNLERIKQVDLQAKLYDRTKPITNRDKGFGEIIGDNGLPNKSWEEAKPMSIQESEEQYRKAIAQQNSDRKKVFQEVYEEKKQKIFDHINSIVNELQEMDSIIKKM